MDDNVEVKFSADIAAFTASMGTASTSVANSTAQMRASVSPISAEFIKLAGAMRSAGTSATSALGEASKAATSLKNGFGEIVAPANNAANGVEKFNKSLDRIRDFAWQNTNLSGDQIDRVINPLKFLAASLGVVGTVGVGIGVAVGAAFAYLAYEEYQLQVATKALGDQLSLTGQINAFQGSFASLQNFMDQATEARTAWDLIGQGAALSRDEAKAFGTALQGVGGVTAAMQQQFTDLAREQRYAFGSEGLQALQGFVTALHNPQTALQTLLTENQRLTPAQRQMAQAALESGNAQRQASTYFDMVTQDLIRQKTEAALTEVAHSKLSATVKQLAEEAIAAARAGGDLEGALQKLSSAGVKVAGDLYRVVGQIRSIRGEMDKGLGGAETANQLQAALDRLDPVSAKVRATTAEWNQTKTAVAGYAQTISDLEAKQARLTAQVEKARDATEKMKGGAEGMSLAEKQVLAVTLAQGAGAASFLKQTNAELETQQGLMEKARQTEALTDRARKAALDEQRGGSELDRSIANITVKYSVDKDSLSQARETTQAIQAELNKLPNGDAFLAQRNALNDKLKTSQAAEADAEKAVVKSKIDYEINELEAGEEQKKLIRQKYAAEMAGLKEGSAEWYDKKKELADALESAEPDTGKSDHSQRQADMKGIEDQIKAVQTTEKSKESLYAEGVKLHLMSEEEKTAATRAGAEASYQAELALLQKEAKLADLTKEQQVAVADKITALKAKHADEEQKLLLQSVEKQVQQWDKMVDAMSSSLSTGIMGMINGTKNFDQVMASLANSVVQQFVKMGVDTVANWAKMEIARTLLSQTAEGKILLAKMEGNAAGNASDLGAMASGFGALIANAGKTIAIDAGQAGAGVTAFLAPIMGPAAIAEGAATQGAVMSMAAFDVGAWNIPQDQLAMVHKGETIMTSGQSQGLRDVIGAAQSAYGGGSGSSQGQSAGSGDTHVHIHPNAMDGQSMGRFLSSNSRQLAKALNQAVKNGDHLGLRRLSTV